MAMTLKEVADAMREGMNEAVRIGKRVSECSHEHQVATAAGTHPQCTDCGAKLGVEWIDAERVDVVNHPKHYTSDPSGVECITITRHRNFNVGNAIKYLWRAGLKSEPNRHDGEKQIVDLRKAVWYIADEIKRLRAQNGGE
jgi:hypothetical protein